MWNNVFKQYLNYAKLQHTYPNQFFKIDKNVISTLKEMDYTNQWKTAKENGWYHLYLADHSFFIFKTNDGSPSYSFYDRPIEAKTIKEFLSEIIREPATQRNFNLYQEEYDTYLTTVNYRKNFTPIRYDLDNNSYKTGVHPAAHIHIGLDNHIRIGLERELTPLAFLLFVIRQMYPRNWENLLESSISKTLPKKLHVELPKIGNQFFGIHEKSDFYFNVPNERL